MYALSLISMLSNRLVNFSWLLLMLTGERDSTFSDQIFLGSHYLDTLIIS